MFQIRLSNQWTKCFMQRIKDEFQKENHNWINETSIEIKRNENEWSLFIKKEFVEFTKNVQKN